jgi:predicted RNA-binding Zn-ribbon protein involved in translation (DUF1610 family)
MPERLVKLTCETEKCENKSKTIEMVTDATQYMCGGCGQFITNAEEVTDGNTEETE